MAMLRGRCCTVSLATVAAGVFVLMLVDGCQKAQPPNRPEDAQRPAQAPPTTSPPDSSKQEGKSPGSAAAPERDRRPRPPSQDRSPASVPPPVPSDDALLEESLSRLKKGNLAYSTPDRMKVGRTAHVTARIGSEKVPLSELQKGLENQAGTAARTAPTPVSTKMKMTLKGADFDITPLSSEEQFVGGDTPTTWEWDVVPKHSGTLRLHLAAIVELNNLSRDFTTVDREIAVQVNPVDAAAKFAKENWHWIVTTVGAGLAAAWAWWKKRRKLAATREWETP